MEDLELMMAIPIWAAPLIAQGASALLGKLGGGPSAQERRAMQLQNETAGLQAEALREGFRRSNELGDALTGLPSAFGKFKRNNREGFKFAIGDEEGNINSFLDSINHNALFNAHKAERRAGLIPQTGTSAITSGAHLASQNEARRAASLAGIANQIGPVLDRLLSEQANTRRYSSSFEDFATREFGG